MSTAYTLLAGPTVGRIDASGIDGLGEYEIRESRIEVDDYHEASRLVSSFSHVEWLGDDPGAPDGAAGDESDETTVENDPGSESDDSPADDPAAESDESEPVNDDADADAEAAADDADDDAVDLDSLGYRELQDVATDHDIKGTQSSDDLIAALHEIGVGAHADD